MNSKITSTHKDELEKAKKELQEAIEKGIHGYETKAGKLFEFAERVLVPGDNRPSEILKKTFNRSTFLNPTKQEYLSLSPRDKCIAILGWGKMKAYHGYILFKKWEVWHDVVNKILNEPNLERGEAYKLFKQQKADNNLPGMGPAYFTKLISFLNPDAKSRGYIMDQYLAKSIQILFPDFEIQFDNDGKTVSNSNTVKTYEDFCQKVEQVADQINLDYLDTELLLFGRIGGKKGSWRKYVEKMHQSNRPESKRKRGKRKAVSDKEFYDSFNKYYPKEEENVKILIRLIDKFLEDNDVNFDRYFSLAGKKECRINYSNQNKNVFILVKKKERDWHYRISIDESGPYKKTPQPLSEEVIAKKYIDGSLKKMILNAF